MRAPERIAAKEAARSVNDLAKAQWELMAGEHLSGPEIVAKAIAEERKRCLAWARYWYGDEDEYGRGDIVAEAIAKRIESGEPAP